MSEPEVVGMDLQPLATRAREQMRVRQNKIRSFMILRFAFSASCRLLKEPALADRNFHFGLPGRVQYTSDRNAFEEAEVAFSWVAGVARVGRNQTDGSNGGGLMLQSMLVGMAKTEILAGMR